jgi:hypothetical protein
MDHSPNFRRAIMVGQPAYDLFVSYAHERDPEWVRSFQEQLEARVSDLLGEVPRIFFDTRMEQGESVPGVLIDAVTSSRILLVVLTPKYLHSPWCQMELHTFLEAGEESVRDRIFVVEAERIDREQWPLELRDRTTTLFWHEDPVTGVPERLDRELSQEYARMFKKRVGEIAHFIRERLQAPNDDVPESDYVWIAEPTDDLVNEWEELAAAVRQSGCRVLPASPYPTHSHGSYTESIRRHLSKAKLFVQLFGSTPGRRPSWGGTQFVLLQAGEAREAVEKCAAAASTGERAAVRWLRWRKSSPGKDDMSEYAVLLRDGEVQESTFGQFKTEVIRCLESAAASELPSRIPPRPLAGDPTAAVELYVHSDEVDRPLAAAIMKSLEPLNVYCKGTPRMKTGQSPQVIRIEQQQAIMEGVHGVLLVYGNTPAGWVGANFSMLRKTFATVRPRGTIGVLNGPPPDLPRIEITGPAVFPIDCTEGVNPTLLAGFVDRVRQTLSDDDRG